MASPQAEPTEILVINIDIEEDLQDVIRVHDTDEPSDVAQSFCDKHGLDYMVKLALQEQIEAEITRLVDQSFVRSPLNQTESSRCSHLQQLTPPKLSITQIPQDKKTPTLAKINQRLYTTAVINQTKARNKHTGQEQKSDTECTFKPKTNVRLNKPTPGYSDQILIEWMHKQKHLQKMRAKKQEDEVLNCKFTPQLVSKQQTVQHGNRFEQLYQASQKKQANLLSKSAALLQAECPFKPDTSATAASNKKLWGQISFRELNMNPLDPEPSECKELFKPKIGRPPKHRDASPAEIGNYLYSLAFKRKAPPKIPKFTTVPLAKSQAVFRKLKEKRFALIFSALNPIEGKISVHSVASSALDKDVFQLILPIVEEMEADQVTLNYQEFKQQMDILIKHFTPLEKNTLINKPLTQQSLKHRIIGRTHQKRESPHASRRKLSV